MKLFDEKTGVSVELSYDGDGFPVVFIKTPERCFMDQDGRPTVEIRINNEIVYEMFGKEPIINVTEPAESVPEIYPTIASTIDMNPRNSIGLPDEIQYAMQLHDDLRVRKCWYAWVSAVQVIRLYERRFTEIFRLTRKPINDK